MHTQRQTHRDRERKRLLDSHALEVVRLAVRCDRGGRCWYGGVCGVLMVSELDGKRRGGCWYCGVCVCVGVLASEMGWEAKEEEGGAGGCVCVGVLVLMDGLAGCWWVRLEAEAQPSIHFPTC